MDDEMIERCAKAAYEKFNENLIGCCEESWDKLEESFKLRMIEAQVAAIKSMREPTEKMNIIVGPDMPAGGSVIEVWQSVIDSILND